MTPAAPRKATPNQREHCRQKHAKLFVRDAVIPPHLFMAFDRGKGAGQFTHMRQRARGAMPGTPDTLLRVKGFPPIWAEWKARGESVSFDDPNDDQARAIKGLRELDDHADWFDSIVAYAEWLSSLGVPMRAQWRVYAEDHDRRADAEIIRFDEKKPPKSRKPRPEKPTAGRVRRLNAVRQRVMH